ncbi:N-acetyltransferase [Halomonas saccharevitans]|uniref:N-acetyltransferase n=1 Tax=Halomonas saccharevitans TaxID=416872 RepID=A0ABU3NGR6_9GAMM|nr:N-acetyltransferase [Halomonas saccharevitans]MDT8879356.1 N-acetyltransferase [Halomonas saccharevitans]
MEFSQGVRGRDQELIALFTATFTASEGASEGTLIGDLVRDQLSRTPAADLYVFTAESAGMVIGGAVFTRLNYDQDDRSVFVLGPVAVATEWQGQGIGRQLLTYALQTLREAGIDIAVTYGDPNYYSRVGFAPVTEAFIPAPFKLQYHEGWLAQSLTKTEMTPLKGTAHCVEAFNDPAFW